MNLKWSMAGLWLIKVGERTITLPRDMEQEARLLAAAPDMLASLKELVAALDARRSPLTGPEMLAMRNARAAIQQATQEE